jgi:SAM-dependent methyltransferase
LEDFDLMSVSLSAQPAVAGGNHYPKYTTRNPLARRLVDGFMAALADLAGRSRAKQVHEVGCGEGFLSTMLAQTGLAVRGSDISAAAVAIARQHAAALGLPLTFRVADLHDLPPRGMAPSWWCAARCWSTSRTRRARSRCSPAWRSRT